MNIKYLKYLVMATLILGAAFTGCEEEKYEAKPIELIAPTDNTSFVLSDIESITFNWSKVEGMNYLLLFSPTEAGLATTKATVFAGSSTSYVLSKKAADNLIAQNTSARPGEAIDIYWTIRSGDGVQSQIRKFNVRRLTEKEIEDPKLELSSSSVEFDANPTGAKTVDVVSNVVWNVTIMPEEASSWLTVEPTSGSDNGTIRFTAAPNEDFERTATVTVSGQGVKDVTVTITQKSGKKYPNNYIIVGNEDCSTAWWSAFSDLVTMTGNQTIHFGFYNNTNGVQNWNNWVIVVTNGKNRGETGYAEYFVLRADAFGWGDANYSGANMSSNYNWDTFKSDMNGAYVDLTVTRANNRIDVTAVTTTLGGATYKMTFFYEGSPTDNIGAFLTCEGAYLAIDPETVYAGQSYTAGSYLVGPADLSAGWWSYFSEYTKITGDTPYPFAYSFINSTDGVQNWNNWLLVVANGKEREETGYAEYFVLRADAFGWGDANYSGANMSHSYDWNNYKNQMKGAKCMVMLMRAGNRIDMTAKVTTAAGEKLGDYTFFYEGVSTDDIILFLLVEKASLDMRTVGYYPFLKLK